MREKSYRDYGFVDGERMAICKKYRETEVCLRQLLLIIRKDEQHGSRSSNGHYIKHGFI